MWKYSQPREKSELIWDPKCIKERSGEEVDMKFNVWLEQLVCTCTHGRTSYGCDEGADKSHDGYACERCDHCGAVHGTHNPGVGCAPGSSRFRGPTRAELDEIAKKV